LIENTWVFFLPTAGAYDNANRHKHPLVPIKLFNNPEKIDPGRKLYTIMSALSRGHPIAVGLRCARYGCCR
jgi:hypothetical protein